MRIHPVQERSQLLHDRLTNHRQIPREEIDMDPRRTWLRWLGGLSAIALLAVLGVYVYDLGVAHGLAEGAKVTGLGGREAPLFGWWRPWGFGFGFGFFPFFPFVILLWLVLRAFFWRGSWYGRGWYGRGWYERGSNDGRGGVPPAFEEWHRRAHGRQEPPAAGTKG
jgi:hypothetical protein